MSNIIINYNTAKLAPHTEVTGGALRALRDENNIINDNENHTAKLAPHTKGDSRIISNRTLIVGPSLCGKTHSFLFKLQLIRLDNPVQQFKKNN